MHPSIPASTTRQIEAHRRDTQVMTDMKQVENPFRNLHPKLYHRQKRISSKLAMANISDLGRTLRTRQQTAVSLSPMILNTSMMKTQATHEEMKLLFPLITPPSVLRREEHFTTSREVRHNILPRIRCGSFISMVSVGGKKEKPERQKISRDNKRPQNSTYPPMGERDNQNAPLPAELSESASHTNKSTCVCAIRTVKYKRNGNVAAVSRNNNDYHEANAERNNSEEKITNVMALKAKLHRSSFV